MWAVVWGTITAFPAISAALMAYIVSDFADQLSSANVPDGYEESNPFARSLTGQFILHKAVVHDLALLAIYLFLGWACWLGLRKWNRLLAQIPLAFLLLNDAYYHFSGFLSNTWIRIGWYVPNVR